MLTSQEVLRMFELINKMDTTEIRGYTKCLQDEFILKYKQETNQILTITEGEIIAKR